MGPVSTQVAVLASQQVLQPIHVSAALSHLAKLHAIGLHPREMERFRASGLVQRLTGGCVAQKESEMEGKV